jgi:hypothetical protein
MKKYIIYTIPTPFSRISENPPFSGILLILVAGLLLIWANSGAGDSYRQAQRTASNIIDMMLGIKYRQLKTHLSEDFLRADKPTQRQEIPKNNQFKTKYL